MENEQIIRILTEKLEQASAPKWISVDDSLPEIDVDVLILASKFKPFNESYGVSFTGFINDSGFWCANVSHVEGCYERVVESFDHEDVTHWMPLPEPPEDS